MDHYQKFIEEAKTIVEREKVSQKCWHDFFVEGKRPPEGVIKPQILASWERCWKSGLDPCNIQREVIPKQEMEELRCRYELLIQATKPVFEAFEERMGDRIQVLDIYDKDLNFIYAFRNHPDSMARRYGSAGYRCAEASAGVTAMSLAKETGEASQLVGAEHYDKNLHDIACTAAPIRGSKKELLGFINMVELLPTDTYRSLATIHAIGQGITYSLQLLEGQRELKRAIQFNSAILEAIGDGIMIVDSNGVISMNNKAALRYLRMGEGEKIVGRRVEDLFGENDPFSQVLRTRKDLTDREFTLKTSVGVMRFVGSICVFGGRQQDVGGVIATFNDLFATQRVIKNLAGWNATMTFEDILGDSPQIHNIVELAKRTASMPSNTLIVGESGTGKEVFAHAIHNASIFSNGPFVTVNCAAIPSSLLESELFGYESGAYTGAKRNGQPGKFELAQNGTILLDEINSMPLDMQVKLLRVLQEKAVTRLGGSNKIFLNIKIIAATNVDLQKAVQNGTFRADLFYRLNVLTIRIPPLRERISDLDQMCLRMLGRFAGPGEKSPWISEAAMDILRQYPWPGNVRELENVLERAWIQSKLWGRDEVDEGCLRSLPEFADGKAERPARASETRTAEPAADAKGGRQRSLYDIRRQEILDVLERNRWNISKAADEMGVARNTLYRRMKKYDIEE